MNPEQLTQLVGAVSDLAAQGAKQGYKSSEFWLHVVSFIPMVLAVAVGASNPITLGVGVAATLGSSIYSACRSSVKSTGLQVVAAAAPALAEALNNAVAAAPK